MKNSISLALVLLPLAAQAADGAIRLGPEQMKSAAIVTAPLAGLAADGGRRLPGQVVLPPAQTVAIGAPLGGVVRTVKAAYGETVKRGQILARVEGPQLLELQREFIGARAQAEVAAEARRRDESLFADGIVSRSRLAVTQASDRQAQALLAEKRAALRLAGVAETAANRNDLATGSDVRAPFDGVVLEAPVQPGQRVEATAVLFKLGRLDRLWIEMQAAPAQVAGLAPGDRVTTSGCATAGRLALISPHLNATTQSLLLRAEFSAADGCLRPFQFVHAQVEPATANPGSPSAWRVPNTAVVRHQGRAWLFAETAGGFQPLAVRVVDEAERATLVEALDAGAPLAQLRIAVSGTAAIKAVWLGLGVGEGR